MAFLSQFVNLHATPLPPSLNNQNMLSRLLAYLEGTNGNFINASLTTPANTHEKNIYEDMSKHAVKTA